MSSKYFSKSRTILRWAFVLVVIGLAAQAGRLLHLRINARTKAQAGAVRQPVPYTVMLREIRHAADGTTTPGGEITMAVRSDGSTLRRSVHKKGSQRTINFSSGLQVDTVDWENAKSSIIKSSFDPAGLQRDTNSKCLNSLAGRPVTSPETLLGEETVAGYRTVKIGSDIITAWYALDYGCALVKDRWEFNTGEVSEKEFVALRPGEPDAALFDVPANYREVPPSERLMGPNKERQPCNDNGLKVLQRLDEDYKRHAAKPQ